VAAVGQPKALRDQDPIQCQDQNQDQQGQEEIAAQLDSFDRDSLQVFGRDHPTGGSRDIANPGDDGAGNTPRPKDVGVEESLDVLDLSEKVPGNGPVFDELVGVAAAALNQAIENVLPGCEEDPNLVFLLGSQRSVELVSQLAQSVSSELVGAGALLLECDEPMLDLRNLGIEFSEGSGNGADLRETFGNIGPPPLDASPVAVGLELAFGELRDPVEMGLVVACRRQILSRPLGHGDNSILTPQRFGHRLGLGGDLGELRQVFDHLAAQIPHTGQECLSRFESEFVGFVGQDLNEFFARRYPPLGEIGHEREQSAAVSEESELGAEHLDLAVGFLESRQEVKS